jgi:hypothetical protein
VSYEVGDWVIGLGREGFGPGQIVETLVRLRDPGRDPQYVVGWAAVPGHDTFQLHLEGDELRPAEAPSTS